VPAIHLASSKDTISNLNEEAFTALKDNTHHPTLTPPFLPHPL